MRSRVWSASGLGLRLALPVLAALVVVPFVKPGGSLWPWAPSTVDLEVYQYIGRVLLDGGDILTARTPVHQLAFIYPPFAAILSLPLVVVPHTALQVVWTAANALCVVAVLFRIGLRGWRLSLVTTGCVLLVEPIRETIGFGQINIMLMTLVVLDLVLPSSTGVRLLRRRWLPEGVLTGLAAAIKVTPALFAIQLMFARRWRAAGVVVATAGGITAVTAVLLPAETRGFVAALLEGDTRTGPAYFLFNQSMLSAALRLAGDTALAHYVGLASGAVCAVLGAYAAGQWQRRGEPLLAVSLCGVATLLASPLSWTHHFVWVVPLGAAVLVGRQLPTVLRWVSGMFAAWFAAGVYKFMPWGGTIELTYGPVQQLISVVGPALGVAVLVAAAVQGHERTSTERTLRPAPETTVVR